MPDNPPISTTVPETTTIDTGADKEHQADINKQFEDFWRDEDAKEGDAAPAAPGEGAAQETKESKPAPPKEPRPAEHKRVEPELRVDEPRPEPIPVDKELSDEEFEKLAMPAQTKQETVEDFKKVKDLWKADRARALAMRQEVDKLSAQLMDAKNNAWTPEAKADYEHAASIRRKFDFVSDPDFQAKFHAPIHSHFQAVLQEAVQVLPDRQAAMAWAKHIGENYSPDQLDRNWWLNSVLSKVPNEMDRASLLQSVTHLMRMQRERDTEITRRTNDKSSFDNWVKEKVDTTSERVREEIMSEIGIQEKRIQEVLPRDVAQAKTKEERQAIEAHNERFTTLNTFFQNTMKDLSSNGPKAWVRASVEATRAQLLALNNDSLVKELKEAKAERDQYKGELDKIAGARRRISSTTGTPPASAAAAKKQTSDGLSLKDLDVRKAMNDYDWGDGT